MGIGGLHWHKYKRCVEMVRIEPFILSLSLNFCGGGTDFLCSRCFGIGCPHSETLLPIIIMATGSFHLKLLLLTFALLSTPFGLQVVRGDIKCEEIPVESCAFSVSSTGARCVLEKNVIRDGIRHQFKCLSSAVMSEDIIEWIESEECINACGLERMWVGMSTDSLLDADFGSRLCSPSCQNSCPNIQDLYLNLAAEEGIDLESLCKAHQSRSRRVMAEILSSAKSNGVSTEFLASWEAPGPSQDKYAKDIAPATAPTFPIGIVPATAPTFPIGIVPAAPTIPIGIAPASGPCLPTAPTLPIGIVPTAPTIPIGIAPATGPSLPTAPTLPIGIVPASGPSLPTAPTPPIGIVPAAPIIPIGIAPASGPTLPTAPTPQIVL